MNEGKSDTQNSDTEDGKASPFTFYLNGRNMDIFFVYFYETRVVRNKIRVYMYTHSYVLLKINKKIIHIYIV